MPRLIDARHSPTYNPRPSISHRISRFMPPILASSVPGRVVSLRVSTSVLRYCLSNEHPARSGAEEDSESTRSRPIW
jgi:hypothetical protein